MTPEVKEADLFRNGRYVVRNRWNNSTTAGAMHLIQQNNTLGAEIELAAAATIVREVGGQLVTDSPGLDKLRRLRTVRAAQRPEHRGGGQ